MVNLLSYFWYIYHLIFNPIAFIFFTLVLLYWIRRILIQCQQSQVMTHDFFHKLFYLVTTVILSVILVALTSEPLHICYDCITKQFGTKTAQLSLYLKDYIFFAMSVTLLIYSVAQNDIFFSEKKSWTYGMKPMMQRIPTDKLQLLLCFFGWILSLLRSTAYCVWSYKQSMANLYWCLCNYISITTILYALQPSILQQLCQQRTCSSATDDSVSEIHIQQRAPKPKIISNNTDQDTDVLPPATSPCSRCASNAAKTDTTQRCSTRLRMRNTDVKRKNCCSSDRLWKLSKSLPCSSVPLSHNSSTVVGKGVGTVNKSRQTRYQLRTRK